jgi:hypothetical protein
MIWGAIPVPQAKITQLAGHGPMYKQRTQSTDGTTSIYELHALHYATLHCIIRKNRGTV